ncbi:hypothetical protein BB558_002162 [Smittium angustum]|uniref:DNA-directed RNA polymerase n=1 Tax=Smittium angustum TaxID=133377 RepID=A0A2U1J9D8_SMIAN|nr:hypothetical protein BB558_002162 [Smittium angustum]
MILQTLRNIPQKPRSSIHNRFLNVRNFSSISKLQFSALDQLKVSPFVNSVNNLSKKYLPKNLLICSYTKSSKYNFSTNFTTYNSTQINQLSTQAAKIERNDHSNENENPLVPINANSIIKLEMQSVNEDVLNDIELEETIKNQISFVYACLSSGNVVRGRRVMAGLYNLYPQKMRELVDVNIHNTIIKSLLDSNPVRAKEALGWYAKMQRDYQIAPDHNTFAILIHGYLSCGINNLTILLIEEYEKLGNNLDNLVLSPFIKDSDLVKIKELSNGRFKNNIDTLNKVIAESYGLSPEYDSKFNTESDNTEISNIKNNELTSLPNNEATNLSINFADQDSIKINSKTQKIGSYMISQISADEDIKSGQKDSEISANIDDSSKSNHEQEVKPTFNSEGEVLGVQLLKKMLSPLVNSNLSNYEKQVRLESEAFDAAASRLKATASMHKDGLLNMQTSKIQKCMAQWLPKLTSLIEDEVKRCDLAIGNDKERSFYSPFIKLLEPEKIAIITIMEVSRLITSRVIKGESEKAPHNSVLTTKLVNQIGKTIQSEYHQMSLKKKENSHLLARDVEIQKMSTNGRLFNITVRKAQAKVERELGSSNWVSKWPTIVEIKLGSLFLAMLLEVAKINVTTLDTSTNSYVTQQMPAFTHSYWIKGGYRHGIIGAHHEFSSMISKEPMSQLLNTRFLPMIVPPKPWLNYKSGGYLTFESYCMRTKANVEQLRYLQHASELDRLDKVLSGLDVLGLTKWAINKPIFDVVLEVWNSGKELAGIPPAFVSTTEPPKPVDYDTNPKAKYDWDLKKKYHLRNLSNNHSRRCDVNYKVSIAQAFLNQPLYFPHNLDFRGRAYPIPPHFNNLGNDLCRGLLRFYDAKPLGEKGLYWLRIQLANSFGYDKFSHTERINFTFDNWDEIVDSAKNPLKGKGWWLKSEDPWQTLAACIDLVNAIESGDPKNYMSSLHVHQDGTCNGLQHYAALGRDYEGAKQVNLVPSERPQDVYSAILRIVEKEVENDFNQGVREATMLRGYLKRKIIKQTVMTNVYGVTIIGAREQIEARLREIENPETGKPLYEISDLRPLSLYLARKVFLSLGQMFETARKIQDWLNEAATRIAKSLPKDSFELKKKLSNEKRKEYVKNRKSKAVLKKEEEENVKAISTDASVTQDDLAKPLNAENININKENTDTVKPEENATPYKLASKKTILFKRKELLKQLLAQPMSSVTWTTPLGLTVVQPYRKFVVRNITSTLQTMSIIDRSIPSPVYPNKQKTAFPPNFIHSLDASHMIMSAISCHKKGISFASVHDSYWTHACDVDVMNDVLRTEFVNLHSLNIMDDLKNEFNDRYGNFLIPIATKPSTESDQTPILLHDIPADAAIASVEASDASLTTMKKKVKKQTQTKQIKWVPFFLPELPKKGQLKISDVNNSPYFFS